MYNQYLLGLLACVRYILVGAVPSGVFALASRIYLLRPYVMGYWWGHH